MSLKAVESGVASSKLLNSHRPLFKLVTGNNSGLAMLFSQWLSNKQVSQVQSVLHALNLLIFAAYQFGINTSIKSRNSTFLALRHQQAPFYSYISFLFDPRIHSTIPVSYILHKPSHRVRSHKGNRSHSPNVSRRVRPSSSFECSPTFAPGLSGPQRQLVLLGKFTCLTLLAIGLLRGPTLHGTKIVCQFSVPRHHFKKSSSTFFVVVSQMWFCYQSDDSTVSTRHCVSTRCYQDR